MRPLGLLWFWVLMTSLDLDYSSVILLAISLVIRNSKLTHMLQSSLGGDCKTLMFVQISPSAADSGETICSLNFASRVRGVEHGPARKQADFTEIFKYKQLKRQSMMRGKQRNCRIMCSPCN